jgi:hypothetical protein
MTCNPFSTSKGNSTAKTLTTLRIGVAFTVGEVPYPDEPMKRAKLETFEHAYLDLQRAKIVSATWRETDDGGPFLAVVIRGGSMLRIWPHR